VAIVRHKESRARWMIRYSPSAPSGAAAEYQVRNQEGGRNSISSASCISCSSLTKQGIGIDFNWCVWAAHWKKNVCNMSKDDKFSSMTMFDLMSHRSSKHTKCWNGKSFLTRPTFLILPHLIITCSDRWYTTYPNRSSLHMKIPKNWSMSGYPQKMPILSSFRRGIHILPER